MLKLTVTAGLVALLVLAAAASSLVFADGDMFAPGPGLTIVTSENYNDIIGKDKPVLLKAAASWCGHCKSAVPTFKSLGAANAAAGNPVIIAKVDAEKERDISSKLGVEGFPTFKYFPAGSTTPEEYQGGRSLKDFIKFLNEKANANLFIPYEHSDVKALTNSNYDSITSDKSNKLVFVKIFSPGCGHCTAMKPAWNQLAKAMANEKGVVIGDLDVSTNSAKAEQLGVQGYPTMKYYVNGGAAEDYNGGRSIEDLLAFVNSKAGTHRAPDGSLDAQAGTTPELNAAAQAYTANGDKSAFTAAAAASTNEWYAKVAAAIDSKGADYVEKELGRITGMLQGGKLSATKRDQMALKRNALNAFKKA